MIFFNETVTAPFSGIILQRKVNISAVAGDSNIVLSLWDPHGVQYDFSIQAGQKMQQRDFDLFRFQIQGSGQAAIALSYPELIDPSIQASLNPNLPQSITTPQLPPSLDSNGRLETRYLSGTDNPDMSVNQSQQYAITESVVSGFATYNASGYFGATGQYVRLSFSIPTNGFLKIKKIYIQTPIYPGRFRLGDEIGFYDNMWILYRNVTWLMSYYQAIVEDADFILENLSTSTTPISYNFNSLTYATSIICKKERIINAGSSPITGYVQLLCDQNAGGTTNPITLSVEFEGNATWTASNTLSSGSGSSTAGGGGCWSGNTLFIGADGKPRAFSKFSEGDLIQTINGLEPIEKIESSGLHEVIEILPNTWITPLQPYLKNGIEKRITELEYQHSPRTFTETFDCTVRSVWLATPGGIYIKDKKID